ncbi:uncharacterized protein LOC142163219 [Nicotiana tabacum]|uniref:Uncharacterized protein LOC142163219 n=1 Tax=Nicotiana tabacum TaxID=4097 RepID=A0AC58RV23_TOBAC
MWVGSKAKDADEYKLWYSGVMKGKNGIGILMDKDLRESVVEVMRVNDRLISIKLVVGECTLNVVSAYSSQAGLDEEVKSYGKVHGGFSFEDMNGEGTSLLDFLKALSWCDKGLCKDCKVIPANTLSTQHRLLVMDISIMIRRKKRNARGRSRLRWGALNKDKAQELDGRFSAIGSWRSSGDASAMWTTTANCVREAARQDEEDTG